MAIAISVITTAYDTYDALVAAIPEYLDGQIDTAQLPGWIGLIEAEINRRLALNPVRPQIVRQSIALDAEYVTLPNDFMKEIALDFTASNVRRTVRFADWTGMVDDAADALPDYWLFDSASPDYTGVPEVAATIEDEMRLYPVPDQTYAGTLLYYAKLAGISETSQSNWFLAAHADVYLYGLLFHANSFLPDPETAQQWFQLFDSRLDQVLSAYPRPVSRRTLKTDLVGFVGRFSR